MKPQGVHEQGSEHIIVLSVSEMFDLETNQHVQRAVSDRQMPTVEYRKIQTDDYSECFGGNSRDCYAGGGGGGPQPGGQGKPTVFTGETLALCQTERNRSGDFCPPEADSLDVVQMKILSLAGSRPRHHPGQGLPPDVPFLCHRRPIACHLASPCSSRAGVGGGGRLRSWRPSAPLLGLCPSPSELSVQPFSELP